MTPILPRPKKEPGLSPVPAAAGAHCVPLQPRLEKFCDSIVAAAKMTGLKDGGIVIGYDDFMAVQR